jgi:hypothetical protein
MDPAAIDPRDYIHKEEQGILYVDPAGEILHRLERRGQLLAVS